MKDKGKRLDGEGKRSRVTQGSVQGGNHVFKFEPYSPNLLLRAQVRLRRLLQPAFCPLNLESVAGQEHL
ncbi:MAG: hypothetical protein DMG06_10300 [Acidobacteria bacterium]|nr:MAG: hypothetical protein DMG06_10300 [Acidobacteriota bacterium]